MDSAPVQSAEFSATLIEALCQNAELDAVDLRKEELIQVLLAVGAKYNFGLPSDTAAGSSQIESFLRGLQIADLALAHSCALGRDRAWQEFIARYREYLTQAATAIAGNNAAGKDLADSLYSEMFGITERGGERQSPLAYYSGRGSLKGFLRATLAQRNVDRHRRRVHEAPLPDLDVAAPASDPPASTGVLGRLAAALTVVFATLAAEERFILAALFLDRRTLLEISRILRVHEATVSRRVQRLTARLHDELLRALEDSGMSRPAAAEALETDPRDLDINLRTLLQASSPEAFFKQKGPDDR